MNLDTRYFTKTLMPIIKAEEQRAALYYNGVKLVEILQDKEENNKCLIRISFGYMVIKGDQEETKDYGKSFIIRFKDLENYPDHVAELVMNNIRNCITGPNINNTYPAIEQMLYILFQEYIKCNGGFTDEE